MVDPSTSAVLTVVMNLYKDIAIIIALEKETQGLFQKANIPVFYSGIGKINAAHKATEVILKYQPKYVLNLGTAGSHKFKTHDLIECSSFVQRDMDLSPLGAPLGHTPLDPIPAKITAWKFLTDLPKGICGTADRFEVGPPILECDLVEMEAYAIAKVCEKMKTPFTAIKYITDGSDDQAHKDWVQNLKPASQKLFDVFQKFSAQIDI